LGLVGPCAYEAEADLVGQLELDAMGWCLASFGRMRFEVEGNEERWVVAWWKGSSGESSFPGLERGTGETFLSTEGGDGQATGGLPLEALSPDAFEGGVFGTCHELAPGLVEGYQPSSITIVARLVLPGAYSQ
jgi:hypothetical protein